MNDRIVWACDCHVATYQATGWSQDEPCDACGSHVRAYNLDALLRVVDLLRGNVLINLGPDSPNRGRDACPWWALDVYLNPIRRALRKLDEEADDE